MTSLDTGAAAPVGRSDLLAQAGARFNAARSLLLHGPAGIGKSTVLDALTRAGAGGALVLKASPAEAEAELPYLALVDLLDGVPGEAFDALPGHLRAALDGALLRGGPSLAPHDQLAVCVATLDLLRTLSAGRAVLLVLDDVQWIDGPSAMVLRFVARRVGGAAVRVLAAERLDEAELSRWDLCPQPCAELRVPPLPEAAIGELLRDRFGAAISRRDIQRVFLTSGGNPLFALELGRALRELRGPLPPAEPLPIPPRLRGLLGVRLTTLPPAERESLLLVAAAARPSISLLASCGVAASARLSRALATGVLLTAADGGIRFAHPILRELAYGDAPVTARREAHRRLAATCPDPVEAAGHLATARTEADELLAASLAGAAAEASRRLARETAADLARLGAERTPEDSADLAAARWLTAARYASDAGALDEALAHATTALRRAENPRIRVGARLLLVELAGEDQSATEPQLAAALAEADDATDLLAEVRLRRAIKARYDGDIETAKAELKHAEAAAEQCGHPERLVEVLTWRGGLLAGVEGEELVERAAALAGALPLTPAVIDARRSAAVARLLAGDVPEAFRRITELRAEVRRSGLVRALAVVLRSVAEVYTRAGRCAEALAAGRECANLYLDVMPTPGPGLLARAVTELTGGCVGQAGEYADRALAACLSAGDEEWIRLAYVTSGLVRSAAGDWAGALAAFRRAYALERRLAWADPGPVLWHPEFIEGLVNVGARDEAAEVLRAASATVERCGRGLARLGLARASALLTAADGRVRDGAAALAEAIERWTDHPYPLEVANAYLVLAGLERRAHRRGAARAAYAEAVARYAAAKAHPLWNVAARELSRLDGCRGARLSDTERRIVDLVRAGATNREIGRSMFLSVKAVEANLTRLYRRFHVSGRSQLVKALDEVE